MPAGGTAAGRTTAREKAARLKAARGRADRYELVFILLVLTFVLGAFSKQGWTRVPLLALDFAALLIAIRSAQLSRDAARALRLGLGGGSLLVVVVVLVLPGPATQGLFAAWVAVVLVTTILVILRRILRHRYVTLQTIFGALSAYLLIGFVFDAVYTSIAKLGTAVFFAGGQEATPAAVQYFSFITLSTTGYGDYTAGGDAGRSMAVLEAVLGQIFLVTLVARLVALYGMPRPFTGGTGGTAGTAGTAGTGDAGDPVDATDA